MPACASSGVYVPRDTHGCDAAVLVRQHLGRFLEHVEEGSHPPPGPLATPPLARIPGSNVLSARTHDGPRVEVVGVMTHGGVERRLSPHLMDRESRCQHADPVVLATKMLAQ